MEVSGYCTASMEVVKQNSNILHHFINETNLSSNREEVLQCSRTPFYIHIQSVPCLFALKENPFDQCSGNEMALP